MTWAPIEAAGNMGDAPLRLDQRDRPHFLVNPICRASEVMAELSRLAAERDQKMAAE